MENSKLLPGEKPVIKYLKDMAEALHNMSQEEFNNLIKDIPLEPPHPASAALERMIMEEHETLQRVPNGTGL